MPPRVHRRRSTSAWHGPDNLIGLAVAKSRLVLGHNGSRALCVFLRLFMHRIACTYSPGRSQQCQPDIWHPCSKTLGQVSKILVLAFSRMRLKIQCLSHSPALTLSSTWHTCQTGVFPIPIYCCYNTHTIMSILARSLSEAAQYGVLRVRIS